MENETALWRMDAAHNNLDAVRFCPVCASNRLKTSPIWWQWMCLDCGAWWSIK